MREMKNSGTNYIGVIPVGWNLQRLRFLSQITTGDMDTQDNDPNGIYPFFVRSPIVEHSNKFSFDNEAVLMAGDGVGAGKVFHYVYGKYACHQRVYSISNLHGVNGKYLFYYMKELFYKRIEESNAKSTVDSVRLPMLKDFLIAFPNLQEQKKIADYLDSKCSQIDAIISKQEQIIEKLKEYKTSLITEVVTKGLDPNVEMKDSGVEWIGEIPKTWSVIRVKHCFTITNGSDPKSTNGDIQVYGSGAKSFKMCSEYKVGPTVLLGRKGTVNIPQYIEGKYWNVDTAFDVHAKGNYNLKLFYYASMCFNYDKYSTQTALPSMTQSNYLNFSIPFFNYDIQQRIADYLDSKCSQIDISIEKKEQIIDKLREYKKSLIYEVVTGKREV